MSSNLNESNEAVASTAKVEKLNPKQIQSINETTVATVEVGNRVARTTEFISDYTRFKLNKSNREVNPNYALLESIEKFGQLSPLIVKREGNNFLIDDGQHRLFCLKKLGLPVEVLCMPEDFEGDSFDAIQALNACSKNWSDKDYISHYIKEGNENYEKFSKAVKDYPYLKPAIIYQQVKGSKASNLTEIYKNGSLKFNPSDADNKLMKELNDLIGSVEKSRKDKKQDNKNNYFDRNNIYGALKKFIDNYPDYDFWILGKKLEKKGFKLRASVDVTDISDLYSDKSLN